MGISGLLPLLKSIQRPIELKKYAGQTIAVDAYGWLHRGAISCAVELAQGRPTRRYIDSVLNRVRMVQHCGVTPYLVFDGDFLPSKAGTEASRAKRREESRKAGQELLNAGKAKQAYLEFQKAIDITPEMARCLIEELKKMGLPYIVAPYEADPQMVYLEREGHVSGILSEDSDLLVFGAKRLLTKLDMQGNCIEINRREFCAVREISLTDWTDVEFRHMAILSGCDYLEGVGNIGLKTAYRMIRKHKTIEKVIRMLQFDGKYKVSENYLAAFYQAELTFLHQRVFCPVKQKLIMLSEPTSGADVEEMKFIGLKMDHETARGVALGELNPMTKEPIILALSPGKKRRASSVASSNGANNNSPFRPAFPSTPNQSQAGKPISEFFGSRDSSASRIPLGAMDPNVFSIDRQQVAALTQNGLTPRVFPLPRPYVDGGITSLPSQPPSASRPLSTISNPRLRRRQSEPVSNIIQAGTGHLLAPTSTPSLNRRQTSAMLPPTTRQVSLSQTTPRSTPSTVPRPQKKARLEVIDLDLPNNTRPLEKSKYFSPSAPASASFEKSSLPESLLMSDDSIEEVMLSIPDMEEWDISMSSKSASMRVFEDTSAIKDSDRIPDSDGIEIPESPVVALKLKRHSAVNDKFDSTPASQLSLGRFSYKGAASMVNGLPTPESSFIGSQESSATKSNSQDNEELTPPVPSGGPIKRPKKPRQSLGELVEATSALRAESDRPRNKKLNKARRSMEAPATVNPSFVPLPPADLDEVAALNQAQGSEDQIVPDSDAEDDELDASVNSITSSSRFDLSRFLCS